jgi:anthranilate synthase component 1
LTELLAGISDPDEFRRLNQEHPHRYPFLLQSTVRGGDLGQFDILFCFPGEALVLDSDGTLAGPNAESHTSFLAALDSWWELECSTSSDNKLPFIGGWFVYLGYELAEEIEPRLRLKQDPLLPKAFAVRCPAAIVFNHKNNECLFVSERNHLSLLKQVSADIADLKPQHPRSNRPQLKINEDPPEQFTATVEAVKKHIEAGDVYQANLSREWVVSVTDELSAEELYADLCKANPGPFAGIVHWQGTVIISSSPERLLSIRDGEISTRPIAGTRPRGANAKSDGNLSSELFQHPKERAEHVMLIDLERNDLGRVCIAGSVEVDELMILESYAHVHHIVSNIRGKLRGNVTPGDAIAAVFPGGTITGCPKVRCMEIINDLEVTPRSAYTGSFGYLNRDGSMDLNILIRTMVMRGNKLSFRAGAGIVADSDPYAELDETRTKAEGLLRALRHD